DALRRPPPFHQHRSTSWSGPGTRGNDEVLQASSRSVHRATDSTRKLRASDGLTSRGPARDNRQAAARVARRTPSRLIRGGRRLGTRTIHGALGVELALTTLRIERLPTWTSFLVVL